MGAAPGVSPGESPVGNGERLALRLESIALDMHGDAGTGAVTTRARVRLKNGSTLALTYVALQISSSLAWQSARLLGANGSGERLSLQQFRVTTDTDHTGAAHELVLTLPKPLAPGGEANLDLYYGGTLLPSAERLVRIGAPDSRAAQADWDGVSNSFVGLRGFGNVLWYPVAAPAALLADGDSFARTVSAERERTASTTLQLSLTLEHTGAALTTAWFLDRPATLLSALRRRESPRDAAIAGADTSKSSPSKPSGPDGKENADAGRMQGVTPMPGTAPMPGTTPTPDAAGANVSANVTGNQPSQAGGNANGAETSGAGADASEEQPAIDTAHWEPIALDGRPVSLFLAGDPSAEEAAAPAAVGGDAAVHVVGGEAAVRQSYADAARRVAPLVREWLSARGAAPLTVLALPSPGTQAFADGSLLVAPLHASDPAALAEALVYPMASAALPTGAPAWVREGVPEFLRLLYLEQRGGRDRMLAELGAAAPGLREAEAARGLDPAPLRTCVDTVCARSKAAYALVMLRNLVGDTALRQALGAMLVAGSDGGSNAGSSSEGNAGSDAAGVDNAGGRAMTRRFEAALLQSSGKDLGWFFSDWFTADRGLPDLQIVQVAPRKVDRSTASVLTPTTRRPVAGPIGAEPEAEADDPRRASPTVASRNAAGLPDGSWLVAVEVQNNGDVAAEVPVTVRASGLQNQLPLRVPAHGRATIRVPFETTPEEVWVNDGTTPEQRSGTHHRSIDFSAVPR